MIITRNDLSGISDLKHFLGQQFEMKDLGLLNYFLGLEVSSVSTGYNLSQVKYASDLLSRSSIRDNKIAPTPLEHDVKLNSSDGAPFNNPTQYHQLVDGLIYLTVTWPNIAYVVHIVS